MEWPMDEGKHTIDIAIQIGQVLGPAINTGIGDISSLPMLHSRYDGSHKLKQMAHMHHIM